MNYRSNRYAGDPRWITARYPGECAKCDAPIEKGADAFYFPRGRMLFCAGEDCGQIESRRFEAAAADEAMGGAR